MSRAELVVVSGVPASGKTTLARRIAQELGAPLLTKDAFKEGLFDTLGYSDATYSARLSTASYEMLFINLGALVESNTSCVVEANFKRGVHEARLLPLLVQTQAVLVHVFANEEVIKQRHQARVENHLRHPGHLDAGRWPLTLAGMQIGEYEPLELGIPVVRIDTSSDATPSIDEVLRKLI